MAAVTIPATVVIVAGLMAAVTDLWKFKVYNALTFPLLMSGLVYHTVTGGMSGLGFSLVGAMFGFAALIIFYALGAVGAGDVKLLAGVGAWVGMVLASQIFLIAGLTVGLYAVAVLLWRGGLQELTTHLLVTAHKMRQLALHLGSEEELERLANAPNRRSRLIPFAALLVVGVVTVVACQHFLGGGPVSLLLTRV